MKRTTSRRLHAALVMLMLLASGLPSLAAAQERAPIVLHTPDVTYRPSLHVTTLEGQTFDLSAQRGKWVLVYFWASWCPPCVKSMPTISQFVSTHPDVTAIGVTVGEPKLDKVQAYAAAHPVHFPLTWMSWTTLQKFAEPVAGTDKYASPLTGIPVTWLIAPNGVLTKIWMSDYNGDQLTKFMRDSGYHDDTNR